MLSYIGLDLVTHNYSNNRSVLPNSSHRYYHDCYIVFLARINSNFLLDLDIRIDPTHFNPESVSHLKCVMKFENPSRMNDQQPYKWIGKHLNWASQSVDSRFNYFR